MDLEINKTFENISQKLFRNSLNYCANFKLFPCGNVEGQSVEELVQATFGKQSVVDGFCNATNEEVINELRNALEYRGDSGSHPSLDYLNSPESKKDFDQVQSAIEEILDRSMRVVSFRLWEGHPFYPVFWDFSYLIETEHEAMLFVASSSD